MIDTSQLSSGIIRVSSPVPGAWVSTAKDGGARYNYTARREPAAYPLTEGNGTYTATVWLPDGGGKWMAKERVRVEYTGGDAVFLQSCVNVPWTQDMECIQWAKGKTPRQIWDWVVENCRYDRDLAGRVKFDYIPDVDRTWQTRKGICYSLTALYAAMLRSTGVKAMMCHGDVKGIGYHAYSRVWIEGMWVLGDITRDLSERKYLTPRNAADYGERYRY